MGAFNLIVGNFVWFGNEDWFWAGEGAIRAKRRYAKLSKTFLRPQISLLSESHRLWLRSTNTGKGSFYPGKVNTSGTPLQGRHTSPLCYHRELICTLHKISIKRWQLIKEILLKKWSWNEFLLYLKLHKHFKVAIHTLPNFKRIRLVSVRSNLLPLKCIRLVLMSSSLLCINIGVRIELT